jgi:signal transduction histidine kinase
MIHTGVGQPIPGDPERISQVINNLLTNAINYSPKGSTITIDTARDDQFAILQVKDEGIGIDKQDSTRIFERFVRIQKGNPLDNAGMGLGLYISAGIVQQHGGTISVESEVNKGALFTVRLPLQ